MNQKYINDFKQILEERGYRNHYKVNYNDNGVCCLSYWYVDVMNSEKYYLVCLTVM